MTSIIKSKSIISIFTISMSISSYGADQATKGSGDCKSVEQCSKIFAQKYLLSPSANLKDKLFPSTHREPSIYSNYRDKVFGMIVDKDKNKENKIGPEIQIQSYTQEEEKDAVKAHNIKLIQEIKIISSSVHTGAKVYDVAGRYTPNPLEKADAKYYFLDLVILYYMVKNNPESLVSLDKFVRYIKQTYFGSSRSVIYRSASCSSFLNTVAKALSDSGNQNINTSLSPLVVKIQKMNYCPSKTLYKLAEKYHVTLPQ